MKVLVTGGEGFIGQHVVAGMQEMGHKVVTVDDGSSSGEVWAHPARAHRLAVQAMTDDTLKGVDLVIHLAAMTSVPQSFRRGRAYLHANVWSTAVLLAAMQRAGVRKIHYASSAAVYGHPVGPLVEVGDPLRPISPYGVSKLAAEDLVLGWARSFGWDAHAFRYFNVYGPRCPSTSHLIPNLLRALESGEPAVLFNKGEQERDLVYVGDVVDAHLLAVDLAGVKVVNVGSGKASTARGIAERLGAPVVLGPGREEEPSRLVADLAETRRVLGWSPPTPLRVGLELTRESR